MNIKTYCVCTISVLLSVLSFSSCSKEPADVVEDVVKSLYAGEDVMDYVITPTSFSMRSEIEDYLLRKERRLADDTLEEFKILSVEEEEDEAKVKYAVTVTEYDYEDKEHKNPKQDVDEDRMYLIKKDGKWYIDLSSHIDGYGE